MRFLFGCLFLITCMVGNANAGVMYDQDVTNHVIFGSGNANGSFTVDRSNGVELGLRAKLRYDSNGNPQNIFNSNGDGSYTFQSGVAPGQSSSTAEWSFEWSINSDYTGTSGDNLNDLTYRLSMTSSTGAYIPAFDPINTFYADHAIGNNGTGNGQGAVAGWFNYGSLINNNNLAQNSWRPNIFWLARDFDPTKNGTYDFTLEAFERGTGDLVASTAMRISAVPEPTSFLVFTSIIGLACAPFGRRRRKN